VCRRAKDRAYNQAHREERYAKHAVWVENHRDQQNANQRKHYHEKASKEQRRAYYEAHKAKWGTSAIAAYEAVKAAVARGDLPPVITVACAHCGAPARNYHHWSYEPAHRLDVIPLCRKCHTLAHNSKIDIPVPG